MISYVYFKLRNLKDSELEACELLDSFAKKCGFTTEAIDEMRLAFIEALINAKEHSIKGNESEQIKQDVDVAFSYENDLLKIQIRDKGRGFDPRSVEKPDIRKKMHTSHKRGWGLMLMERLMDGVEVTSFPPSGTLIQLVKKRVTNTHPSEEERFIEHRRVERLSYILGSLVDLSSFLCQSNDLKSGLRSMLRILLGTLGVSRGAIYTFDGTNESLTCLVDIKLRANTRLPHITIPRDFFEKMTAIADGEVTDLVKNELVPFREAFKDSDIEQIYLLKTDTSAHGILILGKRFKKDEDEPVDKGLLTTLTRNISSAINTFRLISDLKEANDSLDKRIIELDAVAEASSLFTSELEVENLPHKVQGIFLSKLNVGKFSMALFDPTENKYMLYHINRDLPPELDLWSSPISQYVAQTKEALFVKDVKTDRRFTFLRASQYITTSFIVIPIVVHNEVLGLVNLTDKNDGLPFTEGDFQLSQLLCGQLGIVIKNANLYKSGVTDSLTKLYTNHYFKLRLSQEICRLRRVKSQMSILMLSVDDYDEMSAQYGSAASEAILVKMGALIKKNIRFNDLPCRYEGEKFVVLLPDTSLHGALATSEKLHENISIHSIEYPDKSKKVKVSIATTEFDMTMNIKQFVDIAEELLAKAQKAGGDRIVTS